MNSRMKEAFLVCWARAHSWPNIPKRLGPTAGPDPTKSLLVCWARAQGSAGRPPKSTIQALMLEAKLFSGAHPAASLRPTV